jgi:hypothetical protein
VKVALVLQPDCGWGSTNGPWHSATKTQ